MKAIVNDKGVLIVDAVNKEEAGQLEKWYSDNPVSKTDGLKLQLNCIWEDK